ncbi:MAG: LamG-like jellyroll fold domain-containing protein [Opitutaceae bacterium]|nr:LamG-like jellyroll fold domain-containing protein [Opitutaceae bacterium]
MNPQERNRLIDALIEGDISEADFLRLEAEFSVDPEARREYLERLTLSALLEEEGKAFAPARVEPIAFRKYWPVALTGLAAAVAVGFFGLRERSQRLVSPERTAAAATVVEQRESGFAVLAGQAGAVWQGAAQLADGALVPAGQLTLASGWAQIELFSGVTVVVEGDALFEIVSPMEMIVARGKVRIQVPEPARGFTILTPKGKVVDLGTEFALDLSSERPEVHVLQGDVEWHPHAAAMRHLEKGEALRLDDSPTSEKRIAQTSGFIGLEEMGEKLAAFRRERRASWARSIETLQRDPRLVAFFRMNASDPADRRVTNDAAAGKAVLSEGAVVAAARVSDRWGQAGGALDFSPAGSRVRVHVPGRYHALTFVTWVKINSLDRWYNSLFLTDGHDLHEPHWQIMNDGRLFFSVKKRDTWDAAKGEKDKHIYFSPPFWSSALSGRWLMIATVYDPDARHVTHYLNGQRLSREAVPAEYLVETVSIGAASIGNWDLPNRDEPRYAVRNLNGSMDEFALFGTALSPEEIAGLYAQGKP